jgi:hypothetical protein
LGLADVGDGAGERNRGAVNSGHEQATENGLVEVGLGAAYYATNISLKIFFCQILKTVRP